MKKSDYRYINLLDEFFFISTMFKRMLSKNEMIIALENISSIMKNEFSTWALPFYYVSNLLQNVSNLISGLITKEKLSCGCVPFLQGYIDICAM